MNKLITVVLLIIFLGGCVQLAMTKRQFSSIWKTQSTQLSEEEYIQIKSSQCLSYDEQEIDSMGANVEHDVFLASKRVDARIQELGGTDYYMTDHEWIPNMLGARLHVFFIVFKCE